MKLFILLLLTTLTAEAWSPQIREDWDKLSRTHKTELHESTFATFWGGLRRALHWKSHKGSLIDLTVPGFRKSLPVYLSQKEEKLDLYLFYPGVFGKPDGKITPLMIDTLEKMNVHVLVIPDIVAETYLISRPASPGDNLQRERKNQNDILKYALEKIGKKNISKIHLVAESLGCFQAANLDFKFDSMTLLWPPLYLDRSIKRFDYLINKNLPDVQTKCYYWWKWPKITYEVKWLDLPQGLEAQDKDCLGAWVIAEGFVTSIKNTSRIYLEEHKKVVPDIHTFTEFVKTVLPDFSEPIEAKDEELSLTHLLKRVPTPKSKIRITSSVDDFLNDPQEWDELLKNHPELRPGFYLHNWGGHCGPIGVNGFMENVLANP